MVNGVSMDNVEHAFAVQQLRKSGKNAKIVSWIIKYDISKWEVKPVFVVKGNMGQHVTINPLTFIFIPKNILHLSGPNIILCILVLKFGKWMQLTNCSMNSYQWNRVMEMTHDPVLNILNFHICASMWRSKPNGPLRSQGSASSQGNPVPH